MTATKSWHLNKILYEYIYGYFHRFEFSETNGLRPYHIQKPGAAFIFGWDRNYTHTILVVAAVE